MALDEETSKLTTFLLPSGHYRYLRGPIGLSASTDEWCRHSDIIIEGLSWAKKIVDDTLIWADSPATLEQRIRTILQRCRENNITISKKKFHIGQSIAFAGYIISQDGIKPNPDLLASLSAFPQPKTLLRRCLVAHTVTQATGGLV